MLPILRIRAARRGEAGYGSLYGVVMEKTVSAFSKSEIVARLQPLVERGELPPQTLSQVDAGLPITVLRVLGYSDEAIAKSEQDALAAIRGLDLIKGASTRLLREEDLTPARRPGRRVQVDEDEYERLKKIARIVQKFVDTPHTGPPSLQELDDDSPRSRRRS